MKNNSPLISIITPSFNQGQYIEETIRSVLLQDYPNIEYIIIDGGSSDDTKSIIARYKNKISYFVSESDKGQADAINKGFTRASGDFVAWLNSDDIYTEHAVAKAVEQLIKNPECGFVYSNVLSIDAESKIFNTMIYKDWGLKELMQFNIIGQPGVFMRSKALQSTNFLDLDYQFLLDHQLWLKIASKYPIKYSDDFWAAARFHQQAKNVAQPTGFSTEAFQIYNWLVEQPDLAKVFEMNKRKIKAGAYHIKARYLLDNDESWKAFKNYMTSVFLDPSILYKEKSRIAYSLISSFLPIEEIKKNYLKNKSKKIEQQDLDYLLDYLKI